MITRTNEEVSKLIDSFLDGTIGDRDWDDFTSSPISDTRLDHIRIRCIEIHDDFPSEHPQEYCNQAGTELMQEFSLQLKGSRA